MAAWGVVAGVAGCAMATGPDGRLPEPPRAAAQPARPTVIGPRGALPAGSADAVVDRLERAGSTRMIARHLAAMRTVSDAPLLLGNATTLLVDGPATHRAMFDAIASARRHVHLETYILEDGEAGRRLADLLIERRRAGIAVSVLYDAIGAIGTSAGYFERLREAGIAVCEYNPVNPLDARAGSPNRRDHRKILVVDGRVAFTGGINIADVYSSGSASARRRSERGGGWRDTHLGVRGPAVAALQRLFVDAWARQRCPARTEADDFPRLAAEGDRVLRVVASAPGDARNAIRDEWLSAMAHAERSIHLTMAYFVPDPTTLETLEQAARRGVDVQLVLPGFSDFWAVLEAGRSHYARLLAAGVRLHERRDALLHAKTAVIDGVWSTVGSANMDWRSFLHNDEVNVVVIGEDFAKEMEAMFARDVAQAVPVTAEAWGRRGWSRRAREGIARLFEYWL